MTNEQKIQILRAFRDNSDEVEIRQSDEFQALRNSIGSTSLNIYDKELQEKQFLTYRGNTLNKAGINHLNTLSNDERESISNKKLNKVNNIIDIVTKPLNIILIILVAWLGYMKSESDDKIQSLTDELNLYKLKSTEQSIPEIEKTTKKIIELDSADKSR